MIDFLKRTMFLYISDFYLHLVYKHIGKRDKHYLKLRRYLEKSRKYLEKGKGVPNA